MAVRGGQYNVGPGSKAGSRGGRRNASTITAGNRTGGPGKRQGRRGRRWRDNATTGGSANRGTQSSLQPGGGHTRRDSNRRQSGRHNMQEMSESQVVGFLGRKIWQSMNDEDGDISDNRKENFNYYIGTEYGNEREGYSKYVTREVLETVEWVLPSVLRVFLSGDRVVIFEPQNPNDEDAAEQETDITNYFVMRANNNGEGGFYSLHNWMKDALMYPNGYIKCYMEECDKTDIGTVTGITEMGVAMLEADENVEILEQRSRMVRVNDYPQTSTIPVTPEPMGVNPGASPTQSPPIEESPQGAAPGTGRLGGQPDVNTPPISGMEPEAANVIPFPPQPVFEVEVFDLKIRTTKKVMQLRIMAVPPEECLVDNDTMSLNLDEADFVCHRVRKTYTQLVNEGYDPDELDQVGLGEDYQWNDERVNRLFYEDEDPDAEDEDDPSMRTFWVHECYAWYDYDGDGLGEFRRTVLIGDRVFENVETNHQPMIALSAILMQHKHTGMGYVDIMKDLQILGSVLTRQLLDNIYKMNVRKKYFSEDSLTEDGSTMEAMLNVQAEYVPVRGNPANAVVPEQATSIVGEMLPVIQYFKEQQATRTGVTPESQVDPNALQEVRQDVFTNAVDRASQRIEMLVRIFAETGYRQLMLKVHQLLRSHWDVERTIKLRGKWVNVDPQGWRDRTDMYVNVGLGFHTKQQQLTMLSQMLTLQKEAMPTGTTNLKKMYNTTEKMVAAAGLGDARQYFTSPEDPDYVPPEPPPEDPQATLMKAQAQGIQIEQQRKYQEFQVRAQQEQADKQIELQIKQAELATKQQEMQLKARELILREKEMVAEGRMKEGEMAAKLAQMDAEVANTNADTEQKKASADKTMAEAAQIAVELSDTYKQAVEVASHSGEQNLPDDMELDGLMMIDSEIEEDGDEDTE